jgi:integrase/recombinase XerD
MIPMGARAFAWVARYLDEALPRLVVAGDDGTVFLTNFGTPFKPGRLTQLVRDYIDAAEVGTRGSCHLFRHTCATLMLDGGTDVRFIQQLLGHAEFSTTQIYTQVSIRMLKEVHTRTHPGATLSRQAEAELEAELAAEDDGLVGGEEAGKVRA